MRKNISGQVIGAQINSKTDGSAVTTGTTTVYVTGDGGTQAAGSVGSGACTHEGQGFWTYAPAQAETNYDHVAFTFVNTAGVNATVQIFPSFPQTGDNYARLGAPAGASVSADVAAVKAETATIQAKTTNLPAAPASTTNITAGTITTATNLTNLPSIPAGWLTATGIATDAITAAKIADGAIDAATFAAGAINAAAIAADAITDAKVASDVTIASVTGAVGSVTAAVTVSGDLSATMKTSVTTAATAATPTVSLSAGAVQAIWDALTSALTTAGSIGKKLADWVIGTSQTGDSFARIGAAGAGLTALGDTRIANLDATVSSRLATAGYTAPPTVGAIADQVWDEAISGHAGAGSTGLALSSASAPSAATVADAVWDEVLSGHLTSGTTGAALNGAGAAGDPWTTSLPGAYGAGTAGNILGVNLDVAVSSRSTFAGGAVASVTADVGITQAGADKVWGSAARTLTSFGTLVADTVTAVWAAVARTLTAGTNIVLAKGTGVTGFNDLSAAQVNTEADTALSDVGLTTTITGRIDAAITSRLASAGYTAPDNSGIDDIQTRLPAALVGGRMDSSTGAINGDAGAAATSAILNGSNIVYRGTVTGAATASTLVDTGLTQADADWWIGRIVIFTSVIPLQATSILAFNPSTDQLTFDPVTQAPTGASYVII